MAINSTFDLDDIIETARENGLNCTAEEFLCNLIGCSPDRLSEIVNSDLEVDEMDLDDEDY